jgi:hypothetical protein
MIASCSDFRREAQTVCLMRLILDERRTEGKREGEEIREEVQVPVIAVSRSNKHKVFVSSFPAKDALHTSF